MQFALCVDVIAEELVISVAASSVDGSVVNARAVANELVDEGVASEAAESVVGDVVSIY